MPPREPLGTGREVPIVPWLFDVLRHFWPAISVMTVHVLSPQTEAAIAVLLVVVCAGMMSALLQIVFRPLTLLTGMPATGMAWGYLSTMLIGWYASFGTSTSAEAHALGWAIDQEPDPAQRLGSRWRAPMPCWLQDPSPALDTFRPQQCGRA